MDDTPVTQPQPSRRLPTFALIAVLVLVAGLVVGFVVGTTQDDGDDATVPTLTWQPLEGDLQQARLVAPVDYDDPDGAALEVYVVRHPADDPQARLGSLLVNPGGPGFGGSVMALQADMAFAPELLDRFDIVAFDPRGTGSSTPAIDCIDDYDELFTSTDLTPVDDAARDQQRQRDRAYAQACVARTGQALAHLHTANVARDMDLIRRALGEDTISYFGTSYGCELGAVWATLFPDTVRAAVLDACADPMADPAEGVRQQAVGFQASLQSFLARCAEVGEECPIFNGGDPQSLYLELRETAATKGIPSLPGRPPVNAVFFQQAAVAAMYSEDIWPAFAAALATAAQGDGSILTQLADAYSQRGQDGTWGNELEAFGVISCLDATSVPTPAEDEALSADMVRLAPLLYRPGTWSASSCSLLPSAADPPTTIASATTAPLLVLGSTGDPATPLASTERMAAILDGSALVVVDSNQHGSYRLNDCVDEAVHGTLIDLALPQPGLRC